MALAKWVMLWFLVTILVQTYDALFVLLRPLSMEGGCYFHYFEPFAFYFQMDTRYSDLKDPFLMAHSLLNISEVIGYLVVVLLLYTSQKNFVRRSIAACLGLCVSSATISKTLLYLIFEALQNFGHIRHTDQYDLYITFGSMKCIWIILPSLVCVHLFGQLRVPKEKKKAF
jgi:hypothetical protein